MCEIILPNGKRCCAPGAELHHIEPKKLGGRKGRFKEISDSEENLALSCVRCRIRIHG